MREESREFTLHDAIHNGRKFMEHGNYLGAETMFRGVLMHEPKNIEAIKGLGTALFEQQKYHEALFWFWLARKLSPRDPQCISNFGLIWSVLGYPEEGLPDLQRATAIADLKSSRAVRAVVWNNLGNTLERLGKHKEALGPIEHSIDNNPSDPFPHYNRGVVLIRLQRYAEGIKALDHAMELYGPNPRPREVADARYNRGMARLTLGDLKGGFEDHEYRLLTTENKEPNFGFPDAKKWHGESLADTPLLIVGEQGLGDSIQFLRFIPEALQRAPNLSLAVPTALGPMVKECWPGITLIPAKAEIPHDQIGKWCALMSLAHLFGVEKESDIPLPWMPPFGAPSRPLDAMESRTSSVSTSRPLRVGVCWAGNFRHKNDGARSIPLDVFALLFYLPCDFVSLQQLRDGEKERFAALRAKHKNLFAPDLSDLRDTAAIIAHCDLVISADTAVAHLAASIGVPTWILIPPVNIDWRWQLNRQDSPWYPSARLWRGERPSEWSPIIDAMARCIANAINIPTLPRRRTMANIPRREPV